MVLSKRIRFGVRFTPYSCSRRDVEIRLETVLSLPERKVPKSEVNPWILASIRRLFPGREIFLSQEELLRIANILPSAYWRWYRRVKPTVGDPTKAYIEKPLELKKYLYDTVYRTDYVRMTRAGVFVDPSNFWNSVGVAPKATASTVFQTDGGEAPPLTNKVNKMTTENVVKHTLADSVAMFQTGGALMAPPGQEGGTLNDMGVRRSGESEKVFRCDWCESRCREDHDLTLPPFLYGCFHPCAYCNKPMETYPPSLPVSEYKTFSLRRWPQKPAYFEGMSDDDIDDFLDSQGL